MTNFTSYDIWRSTDLSLEGPNCPTCDSIYNPKEYVCHECGEAFPEPDYSKDHTYL